MIGGVMVVRVLIRNHTVYTVLFFSIFALGLLYRTAYAIKTDTWDKLDPVTVIDSNEILTREDFVSLRSSYMGVHGRQTCTHKSITVSSTYSFEDCWYNSLFGDISNYGNVIRPVNKQQAGLFGEDAQKRFIATPNPQVFLEIIPQEVGSFTINIRNLSDTQLQELLARPDGTVFYDFSYQPSANILDATGNPILIDDNTSAVNVWYSQNGEYVLIVQQGTGTVTRINLETYQMLTTKYTLSADGSDTFATFDITNDGSQIIANVFGHAPRLISLSSCDSGKVLYISEPVVCAQRLLSEAIKNFDPETDGIGEFAFFKDDTTIAFYTRTIQGDYEKLYIYAPGTWSAGSKYVALGDSFASGEGANSYYSGTNIEGINMCHLSKISYPYLIDRRLALNDVHSVACSGARIKHVVGVLDSIDGTRDTRNTNQYTVNTFDAILGSWTPGRKMQIDYLPELNKPDIVTISIGGNDMGFGDIITSCVDFRKKTCYQSDKDKAALLNTMNSQYDRLVDVYTQIKKTAALGARVYVIAYPQIVKADGDCGINVRLNKQETEFAVQITNYIDLIVQRAAQRAGVTYVDTRSAFDGHRLCEKGSSAVNGATVTKSKKRRFISSNSYHPTPLGHELLANTIRHSTDDLNNINPRPDLMAVAPDVADAVVLGIFKNSYDAANAGMLYFDSELNNSVISRASSVTGSYHEASNLSKNSGFTITLHSDPVDLGIASTDSQGILHYSFVIPETVPTGFHTIIFSGNDNEGNDLQIQSTIYVAATDDDWDGDGILNDQQICPYAVPDYKTGFLVRDWCAENIGVIIDNTEAVNESIKINKTNNLLSKTSEYKNITQTITDSAVKNMKHSQAGLTSGINNQHKLPFKTNKKWVWLFVSATLIIFLVSIAVHLVHCKKIYYEK